MAISLSTMVTPEGIIVLPDKYRKYLANKQVTIIIDESEFVHWQQAVNEFVEQIELEETILQRFTGQIDRINGKGFCDSDG